MAAWILSIVGVVVVGVLVDIILPEGNTHKYIKGVFGLIALAVIIAPLPKLFNGELSFDSLNLDTKTSEIVVDDKFLTTTRSEYKSSIEKRIKEVLLQEEIDVGYVTVYLEEKQIYQIDYISVYLLNYTKSAEDKSREVLQSVFKDAELKIYGKK